MKKTIRIRGVKYAVKEGISPISCEGCCFNTGPNRCTVGSDAAKNYCMDSDCIYKKMKQTSAPKNKSNNPTKSTPTPSELHGIECEDIFWKLDLVPIEVIFDHLRSKGYTGTVCKTEKIEL